MGWTANGWKLTFECDVLKPRCEFLARHFMILVPAQDIHTRLCCKTQTVPCADVITLTVLVQIGPVLAESAQGVIFAGAVWGQRVDIINPFLSDHWPAHRCLIEPAQRNPHG